MHFPANYPITAKFALEQDREVFAVPGSPLDPRCKGTNSLIKQGATLCESIEDVMAVLSKMQQSQIREHIIGMKEQESRLFTSQRPTQIDEGELTEARKIVSAKLGYNAVLIDELLIQCSITPNLLSLILLELELAGKLQRYAGHKVAIKATEESLVS